jgi:hypothetical protein
LPEAYFQEWSSGGIRVRAHRRNAEATIYVVAEPNVEKAIALLKKEIARNG